MKYMDLIEESRDEMIADLQELISIKSVITDPEGEFPFGAGIQQAFEYMLNKGKKEGFKVENIDNYGGHIDFGGDSDLQGGNLGSGQEIMAIMGHLDVVPEGEDWDHDPYGGELADGKIYGRGSIDNKGPVIAAFYAMKALKASGVIPRKKVRLILGLDEETNWKGMDYYLKRVETPSFGFTPDCNFPAVYGEMGVLVFDLVKKIKGGSARPEGIVLESLTGGNAPNTVADKAQVSFIADSGDGRNETSENHIKEALDSFIKETGYQLQIKTIGNVSAISAQGVSSHGARPAMGLNAISILMEFLSRISIKNEDVSEFIDFYNRHIGFELNGSSLGCGLSDEPSGDLIFNVGMLRIDQEEARLTVNIRYPVTMDDERVYGAMLPVLGRYGLEIIKKKHQAPIYLPKDDEMVAALIDIYRKHTGDMLNEPTVTGCTTYARAVKNSIAFGAVFPGEPELGHQKNEYITVANLMKLTKIFADAIYELAVDAPSHQ